MSKHAAHDPPVSTVEAFVEAVESRLDELLHPGRDLGADILDEATRYLALAEGAKRARPRLVYHLGRDLEVEVPQLMRIAAAGELVHTASLLHDDVVDAGTERRGQPSVNAKWRNIVSILGGDLMLCTSLKELQPFDQALSDAAVDVVERMTRGIMQEVDGRRRTDLTTRDWHAMASGKTGALFGWCASAPARVADRSDLVDRLGRCGHHLGLAFQMADDLRDLVDPSTGKNRFADLRTGSPSFVVIAGLEADDELGEVLADFWNEPFDEATLETVADRVLQSGAVERTRDRITEEVDRALDAMGTLRDRPGGREVTRWARRLCLDVETPIEHTS